MECFEVHTKLIAYLEGGLNDEETIQFLYHIKECEECWQEVELFYTLTEGLHQMDEEEIQIFNFHEEFSIESEQMLMGVLTKRTCRRIVDRIILVIVMGIIFLGITYGIFHRLDYQKNYIAQEGTYEQQQEASINRWT